MTNKFHYKTGKEVQDTVISPLKDIQIMPVKVNQAGEDEPFYQAKGFCVITGEKKFYIFVICGDIVKGNKLLVSMVNFLWPTCFD
ncbi:MULTISPECIES: hypothetical protein [Enterococcus]|uniref:Uncharacterized protein n=2 Tax=Enterococcus TaxID=1350 RepID=A0AAV3GQ87_ENTFL|nr:hypothetical protein [Enterococcus faecalis]EJV10446.1 hypothetical protein HMPREF1334_01527 [Enterococcus faecalis ERV41]KLL22531.1 hypothetical protein WA34_15015 [Streptococcus agalactiae]EEI12951.1 hypothetical protein HMPREF0348_0572 [Enterococcus faecalis TX0104]EGO2662037.1 hypothetical protein [Enterococcus faecalis]EGO2823676.1 hypothetical protein [Enterococcus faecalis]